MKWRPTLRNALLAGAVALSVIPVVRATSLIGTGYSAVGSDPVSVTAPDVSTGAGSFVGTWNGLPITFWCFELTQYFYFGVEYTDYTESPASNPDLARLFEEVGGAAGATSTARVRLCAKIYQPSPLPLLGLGVAAMMFSIRRRASVSRLDQLPHASISTIRALR